MNRRTLCLLFIATAGYCVLPKAFADDVRKANVPYTWIFVSDMHCGHCAKKINAKLSSLTGVAKVQCDLENDFAVITPETGAIISPRVVWETLEEIEFTPVKLQGPHGTFEEKPAF